MPSIWDKIRHVAGAVFMTLAFCAFIAVWIMRQMGF